MCRPPDALLDRLMLGLSDPDDELFRRVDAYLQWVHEDPLEDFKWLPRLRETGRNPLTRRLWEAVEPLLCPQGSSRHEAPSPRPQVAHAPFPESASRLPAITQQAERDEIAGLVSRTLDWHRTLPGEALAEAAVITPGLVRQAEELMAQAERTSTVSAVKILLREWTRLWAGLVGVPEPVL